MRRDQLRKLCNMNRDELQARSRALVTSWYETACHNLGLDRTPDLGLDEVDEREVTFKSPWIEPDDQRAVAAELRARHPEYVEEITRAADALCRHEFTLLGRVVRYDEEVAWQADPVSGKPWPRAFYTRVNIFDGNAALGDVKYVWELNRHQFLPLLGKAYHLTGDERYAEAGLALIDDWVATNPWKIGINWTSALEVAVRSLAWCWACSLFEGSKALTPARRRRILESLSRHGHYLEQHLSFYFSPYNHLIGEATALFVLGSLFPMIKSAEGWRDRGWKILGDQMPKQFHPDGGCVEQSTLYHHFTLGFYLRAILLRRHLGGNVGSRMWVGLERAIEFSMHMTRPDGTTPMIGDADEGKAISLVLPHPWDFRVFLAAGAVLFGRGDFKAMGGPYPPDLAWLLGTGGWRGYDSIREEVPDEASKALPASGYYIMRTGWHHEAHYLAFDCGELAAGVSSRETVSAAHGHADALSVEVASFGEPLLVDPGLWTYNGSLDWHRYFRETEAHNTVVVDERSQAEFRGRLKWSNAPRAEANGWVSLVSLDCVEGSHYGYQRLRAGVVHRRTIAFLKPEYWVVRDELLGDGEHLMDRCFHFATSDVAGVEATCTVQTQRPGRPNLAVVGVEREGVSLEVTRGGSSPASGWVAVGYEQKVRAAVAKYRATVRLPCAFHTLLIPFRDALDVSVNPTSIESDARSAADRAFVVSRPGRRDVWAFHGGHTALFHEGWVTDARSTCVRTNDERQVTGCAFVRGSGINVDGQPLLALDRRVSAAALSVVDGHPVLELSEPATVRTCRLGKPFVVLRERTLTAA